MTNETKERPILFKGEMVRAILDGRKTQTRRAWKPQPDNMILFGVRDCNLDYQSQPIQGNLVERFKCPYGVPGDRLWVRETFAIQHSIEGLGEMKPFNDGRPFLEVDGGFEHGSHWEQPHYKATDPTPDLCYDDLDEPACRWKPSIHMPRWASRINLEIVSVRVERVQDISEEDAKAEGIQLLDAGWGVEGIASRCQCPDVAFADLWDSINESLGLGWDINPWVWVVEFKEIK